MARRRLAVPPPLKCAAAEFKSWRSAKTTRKIPDELWNLAVELAKQYGVNRCSRVLRLDYVRLKRRVEAGGQDEGDSASEPPTFVEVVPRPAPAECTLELERESGTTLRVQLRGVAVDQIAALARELWRAEA